AGGSGMERQGRRASVRLTAAAIVLAGGLAAAGSAPSQAARPAARAAPATPATPAAAKPAAARLPGYNVDRNAYFGDLHVHTGLSFDAYIFNVRAMPDDAYRFAKGDTIGHASG